MKLKRQTTTDTASKTHKWEYSQTQIDTSDITAVRFAIYDNSPDIKHCYEAKRYRAELQLYTDNPKSSTYKLFNYLGNYKTYNNNRYKDDNDPYKEWYQKECDIAKRFNQDYPEALVLHSNLGMPKHHAGREDGSYGFYVQPEYSFHMLANDDQVMVEVAIGQYRFTEELNGESTFSNGKCRVYFEKFDVQ